MFLVHFQGIVRKLVKYDQILPDVCCRTCFLFSQPLFTSQDDDCLPCFRRIDDDI